LPQAKPNVQLISNNENKPSSYHSYPSYIDELPIEEEKVAHYNQKTYLPYGTPKAQEQNPVIITSTYTRRRPLVKFEDWCEDPDKFDLVVPFDRN